MTKNLRRTALIAGASAALVLVPAGVAFAAAGNGNGPHRSGDPAVTCPYDQDRQQLRLHDGTGPRHDEMHPTTGATAGATAGGYQSGPVDGSGPLAERPLDGTGNQWGRK